MIAELLLFIIYEFILERGKSRATYFFFFFVVDIRLIAATLAIFFCFLLNFI